MFAGERIEHIELANVLQQSFIFEKLLFRFDVKEDHKEILLMEGYAALYALENTITLSSSSC